MADITEKVTNIRKAVYGRDVRESIASAIEAIDDVAENSRDSAKAYAETAQEQATEAATQVDLAKAEVENAKIEVNNAEAQVTLAKAEVENAKIEVSNAEAQVTLAKAEVENAKTEVVNATEQATIATEQAALAKKAAQDADSIVSGEKLTSLIDLMGEGDISSLSDGTVTGALLAQNIELVTQNTLLMSIIENNRNGIFRGKYLGDSVTDEQWTEIANGTFNDMFIGDYWYMDSRKWRIAGFNYFYTISGSQIPHLVVVPDSIRMNAQMHSSDKVDYSVSTMNTSTLPSYLTVIQNLFGNEHLFQHRVLMNSSTTSAYTTVQTTSNIELMDEIMVTGTYIYSAASDGTTIRNRMYQESLQLPLFRLQPSFIRAISGGYWLKNSVSSTMYAVVNQYGGIGTASPTQNYGVRPIIAIY